MMWPDSAGNVIPVAPATAAFRIVSPLSTEEQLSHKNILLMRRAEVRDRLVHPIKARIIRDKYGKLVLRVPQNYVGSTIRP